MNIIRQCCPPVNYLFGKPVRYITARVIAKHRALAIIAPWRSHERRNHRCPRAAKPRGAGFDRSSFWKAITPGTKKTAVLIHTRPKQMSAATSVVWIVLIFQLRIELVMTLAMVMICSGIQNFMLFRLRINASDFGTSANHVGITKSASYTPVAAMVVIEVLAAISHQVAVDNSCI